MNVTTVHVIFMLPVVTGSKALSVDAIIVLVTDSHAKILTNGLPGIINVILMPVARIKNILIPVIAMRDILVMVSPVTMSTSVAAITHAAITLLVIITRLATTAAVITDSLEAVMNLLTSTNAKTVLMHVIKTFLARTMSVHILATLWSGILGTVSSK